MGNTIFEKVEAGKFLNSKVEHWNIWKHEMYNKYVSYERK